MSVNVFLRALLVLPFVLPIGVAAQAMLQVPQPIWDGLLADQRDQLTRRHTVSLLAGNSYGTIIDAQSLDESTPGSNAGSALGSRIGSATYVDSAFQGRPQNWNYSATGHLSAQLLGAAIGSLANTPHVARFRTRYTVRHGSGSVEYIEEIKQDAFRHTVGLCVALNPIRPIETDVCTQTREQFMARYFSSGATPTSQRSDPQPALPLPQPPSAGTTQTPPPASGEVRCKFGLASPVRTSSSACEQAGGIILP